MLGSVGEGNLELCTQLDRFDFLAPEPFVTGHRIAISVQAFAEAVSAWLGVLGDSELQIPAVPLGQVVADRVEHQWPERFPSPVCEPLECVVLAEHDRNRTIIHDPIADPRPWRGASLG